MSEPTSPDISETPRNPHADKAESYFRKVNQGPLSDFTPAQGVAVAQLCKKSGEDPKTLGTALLGDSARIMELTTDANKYHRESDPDLPPVTTALTRDVIERVFGIAEDAMLLPPEKIEELLASVADAKESETKREAWIARVQAEIAAKKAELNKSSTQSI